MDVTRKPPTAQPNAPALVQTHKTTSTSVVVQPQHTTAPSTPTTNSATNLAATLAPLPSQTAWAQQQKHSDVGASNVGINVVGVRSAIPSFPDGQKWVAKRLCEIAALTKLGVPVSVVFDLDNTVFDTRHRTLFALREFDRLQGTSHFAQVSVDDVQLDAAATATKLGLPPSVVDGAQHVWSTAFWTPDNLVHDQPIADMVELIHRCQAAGATVKFLTGRTQPFHQASLDQLKKAGVDVAAADVVCKPDVRVKTAPFKEQTMMAWAQQAELGFFVTEGVRDLEHMQSFFKELPLLRLDCSLEEGHRLPHVPRWPAAF